MKRLFYIFAGFVLLAGCVSETPEVMTEKHYCTVTAGFSGKSTKVSLTQDTYSKDMIARWQSGDKIKTYMLTDRKTVENPASFLYDISEDGKSGVFTYELDDDIRLEREGYRLFAYTVDDDYLDEPRELTETPYIDCSLRRVPLEEFRAPVLYDGMVSGSDFYCHFRHIYTYELLHVKNSSSSDISFSLLGFEATLVWYKIFASFDMTPDGLQEGSPSTARCHPVETSSEITIPAGATGVIVSAYIPNGQSIQDATLVASINGAVVRTVDTKSSGAVLQPGRAYHMYVTWDGKELCYGNVEPYNPTVPEAVDLGLPSGVKWASFNLGASAPEEYGDYFAWAETEPMENPYSSWNDWKYCENLYILKYNNHPDDGPVDNLLALEMMDDAPAAILGGDWRTPTFQDVLELFSNCDASSDMLNGVYGYRLTAANGNSIFLPFSGYCNQDNGYAGQYGFYWTSNAYRPEDASKNASAYYWAVYENGAYYNPIGYTMGLSIRPVQSAFVELYRISLSQNTLSLLTGDDSTVSVAFFPENATHSSVYYCDVSDESVISITESDNTITVSAVAPGEAVITVWSENGLSASCSVKVKEQEVFAPEAVDLGLPSGLKWATFNVGANRPEDYGDYFAWGETVAKSEYSWSNYIWCKGNGNSFTKYCPSGMADYWGGSGSPDNKIELDSEDDAAHANWDDKWRMPTSEEWTELRNNCTWTWTDNYNGTGVAGQEVTSSNGNSIFLPAAGRRVDAGLDYVDSNGFYWSSSLNTDRTNNAWGVYFFSDNVGKATHGRYHGISVRPVWPGEKVELTSIVLDCTTLTLKKGESHQLSVGYTPQSANFSGVDWLSSNAAVASVDQDGVVSAKASGIATITATSKDNPSLSASCEVTVPAEQTSPVAVDFGLPSGLKWASYNLGATAPEEYGEYYSWGETTPKENYDVSDYKWYDSESGKYLKYVTSKSNGVVDDKTILDIEDDAAAAEWGGDWRMPTRDEWEELMDKCKWKWTRVNGVQGWKVTGLTEGYENNTIFLPCNGGYKDKNGVDCLGYGYYWSSTLNRNGLDCSAYSALLDVSLHQMGRNYLRATGFAVRAVCPASD